jgi:serine/threonine protein phosphatase PrpC
MRPAIESAAGNPENQDRAAVIETGLGFVLVVADGAGGRSGGKEAAMMAVDIVREGASRLSDPDACVALQHIQAIFRDKVAGETTCVLAVVNGGAIYGASVGDSGAWLISETAWTDLTKLQSRKPFIGSGAAAPCPFEVKSEHTSSLLLATDGLLKYTSPERIIEVCRKSDRVETARRLIELVRYPSGALPDDVTVIVAALDS